MLRGADAFYGRCVRTGRRPSSVRVVCSVHVDVSGRCVDAASGDVYRDVARDALYLA